MTNPNVVLTSFIHKNYLQNDQQGSDGGNEQLRKN